MQMDRRVTVQTATESQDATTGEVTRSYSDGDTIWMHRRVESGSERLYNGRFEAAQASMFVCWWDDGNDAGIDRDSRLKEGGDIYRVHTIREVGRKETMEITTTRVRAYWPYR